MYYYYDVDVDVVCECSCAGGAFPWTVTVGQFSVYTLLGHQSSLSLLEPIGCTSTLAVTSHKLQPGPTGSTTADLRPAFIICLHVDLQPLHLNLHNPQVELHVPQSLTFHLFSPHSAPQPRLQTFSTAL